VVGRWEIVSMTGLVKPTLIIPEFITSNITHRKLNEDNYL